MAGPVQDQPRPNEAGDKISHDPEPTMADHHSIDSGHRSSERSQSSTKSLSLSGSVFEQILENERAYANHNYFMPCDEQEQTRLAVTHQCFTSILNGQLSFRAIPRSAKRILDIGTGTGDWAVAVAERFPNVEVVATDITCFQPTDVPSNVFFEIDDAQEEWTYTEPFGFIHIRGLSGAFRDWTSVYRQAFKHLQPNGILEVADFGLIQLTQEIADSYLSIYNGACLSAAERSGSPPGLGHVRKSALESAGFSVAKSRTFNVPLGTWSPDPRKKVAGKMALISMLESLEASSLRLLTQYSGFKAEDVRDLCRKVQEELMQPGVRPFVPCQFTVGRKLVV
ncbi:MAG: hypothetical protein Q9170_008043 [Blastenia crenularia]